MMWVVLKKINIFHTYIAFPNTKGSSKGGTQHKRNIYSTVCSNSEPTAIQLLAAMQHMKENSTKTVI